MARTVKKQRGVYEHPKKTGVWWVLYYDQFKRRHREKVGLKSAAISIYRQRKTEVRQGKFDPEDVQRKHQNALVSEIIEDFIKASEARNRKSIDDIRQRLSYWGTRLGDRAANSILNSDIEAARLELAQGRLAGHRHRRKKEPRTVATVNRYLATLKSVLLLAIENEKVTRNPFRKVKLQKENNARVRYLTEEEEGRLFAVLPTQYHALVLLAMQTGLRRMELFRVQWDDINLQQRFLWVRESKSGLGRNLPLNDVALSTLHRIPRRIGSPFVFPGDKAGTHRTDVPKSWEGFLKQAGIVGFKWHDLRHTFASRLVMAGVDLYTVSKLLGHADIKMTQRYSHLSEGHLNEAVNRLNSFPTATKTATSADAKTRVFS